MVVFKLVPYFHFTTHASDSQGDGRVLSQEHSADFEIPFRLISKLKFQTMVLDESKEQLTNFEIPLMEILTGPIHHDHSLISSSV